MTGAGWAFMLVSVSFVVALAGWCYARVLRADPPRAGGDEDATE